MLLTSPIRSEAQRKVRREPVTNFGQKCYCAGCQARTTNGPNFLTTKSSYCEQASGVGRMGGPEVGLKELRMAITTCCLEKLGTTWSERYGELEGFKVRFGNCLVPRNWPENHQLANWVGNQRAFFRRNKLAVEQIQKLNAIGFEWEPIDRFWEESSARFVQAAHQTQGPKNFLTTKNWPIGSETNAIGKSG